MIDPIPSASSGFHWLVPLFAALASCGLGVFVYSQDRHNDIHRVFGLMSATLCFWNLDIFSLQYASAASDALNWSRLGRVGMLLMPPTFLHFAIVFSSSPSRRFFAFLVAGYAIASFLIVANSLDLLVLEVQRYTWGFYPRPRPLYAIHSALFVTNALLAFLLLSRRYRSSASARWRLQARFWMVGLALAGLLGSTNLLAVYGIPIYPLGSLASVAFSALVAYAIVEHRLMDVDLIISRWGAFGFVALLVIAPAFFLSVWMQHRVFGRVNIDFSVALLVLFFLVAAVFPTLRTRAEARIERSFFSEKHAYRSALARFTRSIVRIFERERLIRELASTLGETLQLDHLAVMLNDEADDVLRVRSAFGPPPSMGVLRSADPLVRTLLRRQEAVLTDELQSSSVDEEREAGRACSENRWDACVPLTVGNRLTGIIGLGRKRSLDPFFVEDLDLLATLAAEASVALENARLYDELRRSQDIIRRADRLSALGTLAAGIAHEIRNPLVSIQTFFQLAPQRLDDQEFLNEFLRLTSGEVKRITDLITDLLSFARSPTASIEEVDLNELVEGVCRLVEPQFKKRQIRVQLAMDPALPQVRADRDQLKQVFLNIFLNAVQAVDVKGEISVLSREISHEGGGFCQVRISDSGEGIAPDLLEHIFDPFFTTKEKGIGLGLSISNQVILEHGGFISVDSEPGAGTTISVHLPSFRSSELSHRVA